MTSQKVLIIEDNLVWQKSYQKWIGTDYIFEFAAEVEKAKQVFIRFLPDIVLLDLGLPKIDQGLKVLDFIISQGTDAQVIIITASKDHQNALEAQKRGASSYFFKSENIKDELPLSVKRALRMQSLERENQNLRKKLTRTLSFDGIIAVSRQMQNILNLVEQIHNTNESVLLTGESGVGKEVIAHHIHARSVLSNKPFVAINSAALPENLLENELFGHEKGAYTGAHDQKKGQLELVDGGTLFLDEIGELPIPLQAKLLRVLQEKKYYRLGGTKELKADFRLICATNKNLDEEVANKNFREDLYYRLNVIPIHIPPLRERPDDIPAFINYFTARYCEQNKMSVPRLEPNLIAYLSRLQWNGNIRQLENLLVRLLVLKQKTLTLKDLPNDILTRENSLLQEALQKKLSLEEMIGLYINLVYEHTDKNKKAACDFLGINYRTLSSRLK